MLFISRDTKDLLTYFVEMEVTCITITKNNKKIRKYNNLKIFFILIKFIVLIKAIFMIQITLYYYHNYVIYIMVQLTEF